MAPVYVCNGDEAVWLFIEYCDGSGDDDDDDGDELGVVDGLDITVKTDYELLSVLALISFVTRDMEHHNYSDHDQIQ